MHLVEPTRQTNNESTSSLDAPRLPLELIERITALAARLHPWTKLPLALCCRDICKWTARARWHTILLTRPEQAILFSQCILLHYQQSGLWRGPDLSAAGLPGEGSQHRVANEPALSLPASIQGCIKALFLHPGSTSDYVTAARLKDSIRVILRHQAVMGELDLLDIWSLDEEEIASSLLYLPRELTIGYGMLSHHPVLPPLHAASTARTRLKRLHLIGAHGAEPGGLTMPYEGLARWRKGGVSVDGAAAALEMKANDIVEARGALPSPAEHVELTHIRYDTARFSFKPPEIVAGERRISCVRRAAEMQC